MTRTLSIAIKENIYQHLKQKIGYGKISSFVNRAVEKELKGLINEQKREKEQLRKRSIAAYQRQAKNKNLQKELAILEEASVKDIAKKLIKDDRKPIRPVLVIIYIENTHETGLDYPSKIQLNYPFTVDKERFKKHLGVAGKEIMEQAKMA
ncbi:11792_t:CDS:2 [Entrophospora sp. SA101]|nr:11792_t:CDS:2 [Entrophospora sp. SA101]CAJ0912289.1 9080_t:CDS:2 [Entrophospora sp. SA101]